MARRTQLVEEPGTEPREMPDAGMFAAADQITVAGHDYALVLGSDEDVAEAARLVEGHASARACDGGGGVRRGAGAQGAFGAPDASGTAAAATATAPTARR